MVKQWRVQKYRMHISGPIDGYEVRNNLNGGDIVYSTIIDREAIPVTITDFESYEEREVLGEVEVRNTLNAEVLAYLLARAYAEARNNHTKVEDRGIEDLSPFAGFTFLVQ